MTTWIRVAILASAIVGLGGAGLAAQQPTREQQQPGPPPDGEREEPRGPAMGFGMGMMFGPSMLLDERGVLALTPDQVTRLSTLETEVRQARDKTEAEGKPHREELEKLWEQPTPDAAQMRTHAQALMQAHQAAGLTALTAAAQAKAILTPEQRGRVRGWADARGRMMGRGAEWGRMRRGPGTPGGPGGPFPPRFRPAR